MVALAFSQMKTPLLLLTLAAVLPATAAEPPEPKFRAITIDAKIQIGYGLAVTDVDGDKLPDILLADKKQFVWYRNPGAGKAGDPGAWSKFVLAENLTKNDNVCIAAQDIDGDGKCEVAVGAEWNPGDTVNSGAVFYLIPPEDRTQPWTPVKLHAEPTTHRMRWINRGNDDRGLVVLPLHGRGNKNGEGAGVKVLFYRPPTPLNDPQGEWKTELIDESMHMTHNLEVVGVDGHSLQGVLVGGKEGANYFTPDEWKQRSVLGPDGYAISPAGVGELRRWLQKPEEALVTIEPMHGSELVSYFRNPEEPEKATRRVISSSLFEGHALACGDLLGTGSDQVVVGWRGKAGAPDSTVGVAVFTAKDPQDEAWRQTMVDSGGMACEDLQLADLNGDGRLDIVASGRATKNVKIYFNETSAAPR